MFRYDKKRAGYGRRDEKFDRLGRAIDGQAPPRMGNLRGGEVRALERMDTRRVDSATCAFIPSLNEKRAARKPPSPQPTLKRDARRQGVAASFVGYGLPHAAQSQAEAYNASVVSE
jgi:hypothetical protein